MAQPAERGFPARCSTWRGMEEEGMRLEESGDEDVLFGKVEKKRET